MQDLERRLTRLFVLMIGIYISIKSVEKDMSDNNLLVIIVLISIFYMLIDTYIPRVHINSLIDENNKNY